MTEARVWWNSRYLAYCRAMGTPDPHERRALDEAKYPDAPFLLAIFWVDERWREWEKLNRLSLWEAPRSRADHEAFDRWLEARTH